MSLEIDPLLPLELSRARPHDTSGVLQLLPLQIGTRGLALCMWSMPPNNVRVQHEPRVYLSGGGSRRDASLYHGCPRTGLLHGGATGTTLRRGRRNYSTAFVYQHREEAAVLHPCQSITGYNSETLRVLSLQYPKSRHRTYTCGRWRDMITRQNLGKVFIMPSLRPKTGLRQNHHRLGT